MLLLFIALPPFGVIEYFGLFEVPLVVALAACFLLIEKMAIHLQDPFENKPTDTPMTTIAKSIENNLSQLYGLKRQNGKSISKGHPLNEQDDTDRHLIIQKVYYVL